MTSSKIMTKDSSKLQEMSSPSTSTFCRANAFADDRLRPNRNLTFGSANSLRVALRLLNSDSSMRPRVHREWIMLTVREYTVERKPDDPTATVHMMMWKSSGRNFWTASLSLKDNIKRMRIRIVTCSQNGCMFIWYMLSVLVFSRN